jgi:hypothetical protein
LSKTWIFQANSKRFDIDGWLASGPVESEWLVSRYADQIAPGDDVYLWRSMGDGKGAAGVFAKAKVVSPVRRVRDDGPPQFWADPQEADLDMPRVRIALTRVANPKEMIKRDWWKEDPILRDHLIMKMPNHTTFALEQPYLGRLDKLWAKTGVDWDYADSVAGLRTYVETQDGLSKLPGSVVADTALLLGRAVLQQGHELPLARPP